MAKVKLFINRLFCALYTFYWRATGSWQMAKFFVAWREYQRGDTYRTRLTLLGFRYAFETFLKYGEWKYYLKLSLDRHKFLWWQLVFCPWSIERPVILETAARSNIFKDSAV